MPRYFNCLPLAITLITACMADAAHAQYALEVGDVVSFSVIGAPELGRNASVDIDGRIVLPLIGEVAAAGATIPELRGLVSAKLAGKSYVIGEQDGSEVWSTLRQDQIMMDIHDYRPVSVLGDVFRPGTIPFRAGLSVRQALAEVGGLRMVRVDPERLDLLGMELRAERNALDRQTGALAPVLDRLSQEQRMIADGMAMKAVDDEIVAPGAVALRSGDRGALDLSHRQLDIRLQAWRHDVASAKEAAAMLRRRLEILIERRDQEEETREFHVDEYRRIEDLAASGVVPRSALADARRDLAFATTRALETGAEVARVEREVADVDSEIEGYWRSAEISVMADLEERSAQMERLRADLQSVEERLDSLAGVGTASDDAGRVNVTLHRTTGAGSVATEVDMDAALHPGDVLEVEVRLKRDSGL